MTMKPKDWVFAVVEAVLWYMFIYSALYAVKNQVDLAQSALILLVIAYAAAIACPLVRNSPSWRRTWGQEQ